MDKLSTIYGLVSAFGTLIAAIDHLVTDLRSKGKITEATAGAIAPALASARDAHSALIVALTTK